MPTSDVNLDTKKTKRHRCMKSLDCFVAVSHHNKLNSSLIALGNLLFLLKSFPHLPEF